MPNHYKIAKERIEEYEGKHPADRRPDTLEMAKIHTALYLGEKIEELTYALLTKNG